MPTGILCTKVMKAALESLSGQPTEKEINIENWKMYKKQEMAMSACTETI